VLLEATRMGILELAVEGVGTLRVLLDIKGDLDCVEDEPRELV
jgi:hypothetical protein